MSERLGLKTQKESDFQNVFSELLDTLEALELDFNHFFRRLSEVSLSDIESEDQRRSVAHIFFHSDGIGGIGNTIDSAEMRIGNWLHEWGKRILEDWGTQDNEERQKCMKAVNPKVSKLDAFEVTSCELETDLL